MPLQPVRKIGDALHDPLSIVTWRRFRFRTDQIAQISRSTKIIRRAECRLISIRRSFRHDFNAVISCDPGKGHHQMMVVVFIIYDYKDAWTHSGAMYLLWRSASA